MNKAIALFESIMYVVIGGIVLRIGYFLYSYIVFDWIKTGKIEASVLFDSPQEQAISYIDHTAIIYIAISWLVAIGLIVLTVKLGRYKLFDQVYSLGSASDLVMSVLAGIGTVLLTFSVIQISAMFFDFTSSDFTDQVLYFDDILITMLAVGVLIPILEEVFFRGIIFNRLFYTRNAFIIIFLSTSFFLVSHFNIYQGIYLLPLGIITGVAVLKSRSVLTGIIIHMVFNTLNMLMNLYYDLNYQIGQLLMMIVLALVLIMFSLGRICNREAKV